MREANMVVSRDQKACCPGRRIVDSLADLRVNHRDDGSNDMAWGAKLPQLTGLFDLPQHMLEQVALGVGVRTVETETIHQGHDLRQNGRLVDNQACAFHEI